MLRDGMGLDFVAQSLYFTVSTRRFVHKYIDLLDFQRVVSILCR